MKITKEFLKEKGCCPNPNGLEYFDENNLEGKEHIEILNKLMSEEHYDWASWLLTILFTKENRVRYAIFAAELVLPIWEKRYPDDGLPKEAIEAAKAWLANPTEANAEAADYASGSAFDAACDAAFDAASAYAAVAAADTVNAFSANSASAHAANAAYAAARAYDADGEEAYLKIINFGLELLSKQNKEQ